MVRFVTCVRPSSQINFLDNALHGSIPLESLFFTSTLEFHDQILGAYGGSVSARRASFLTRAPPVTF